MNAHASGSVAAAAITACALVLGACASTTATPVDAALPACHTTQGVTGTVSIASDIYEATDRVLIYQPPCTDGAVDVLYLLHGAGADETQWSDIGVLGAVERTNATAGHPMVLVIPNVAAAYQCDRGCEDDLATYLLDEVEPTLIAAGYEIGGRAIGGISRGGGLALGAASARPDVFAAAGGHSPASVEATTFEVLAGNDTPIWLDVGADDPLADGVEGLAGILDTANRVLVFEPNSGGHDRTYWRAHTPDYIDWYRQQLGAQP